MGIGVHKGKQCPQVTLEGDRGRAAAVYHMARQRLDNLMNYVEQAGFNSLERKIPNFTGKGDNLEYGIRGNKPYIKVYSPVPVIPKAKINEQPRLATMCFCSCFFAQARVLEVINEYDYNGPQMIEFSLYPNYCSHPDSNIRKYVGIRYRVAVCQKYPSMLVTGGVQQDMAPFIAPSIGFTPFVVDDRVLVMYRGAWIGNDLELPACGSCFAACMANRRTYSNYSNRADGSFVLLPIQSYPITGYLEDVEIA